MKTKLIVMLFVLTLMATTKVCHTEKVRVGKRDRLITKCTEVFTAVNKAPQVEQLQYGCFEVTRADRTVIVCYEPPPGLME